MLWKLYKYLNITWSPRKGEMEFSPSICSTFVSMRSSNPLLSLVVDHKWRKDSFRGIFFPQLDVIIYVPEAAKNMIAN